MDTIQSKYALVFLSFVEPLHYSMLLIDQKLKML